MKTRILLGCAAGLLSLAATAQDETAPAETGGPSSESVTAPAETEGASSEPATAPESSGNAWTALQGRYYVTPSLSWVIADSGRQADDGQALTLAVGRPFGEVFALEAFAQYNRFDHEEGSGTTDLIGLGVNSLFFPTNKVPAYLLVGAGYGDVSSHPGGDKSYGSLLLNVGGGYWWKPFDFLFKGVSLRTEAVYRLDAHNDRRTGADVNNGRKDFGDILLSLGLNIPIGEVAAPPPPAAEPVEVVPVMSPWDSDGDGVPDDLDQCPDTPAGTAVDANGCPAAAAPASTCKAPEPGEKLNLAGCGTGDIIVLKGVNFDFDKDRLTVNAKTILDGVGEALKASPATNVELGGHTDGKGSDDYNRRLSDRRACSVARYLSAQGIAGQRMTPTGYGESKPVADNETDEGREQNRRVELKILDGAGTGLGSCRSGAATPAPKAAPSPAESPAEATQEAAPAAPATTGEAPSAPSPPAAEPTPPADSAPTPEAAALAPPTEAPPPVPPSTPPAPAPAPAGTPPPAVSSESMQMVPAGDVFGASAPAGATSARPSGAAKMVSEDEVFGTSAPVAAPKAPPSSSTQMVPENEVFGGKN